MVYTPRVVGTDKAGVQPLQPQAIQGGKDNSDQLLQAASQANVYGYNMMQQGVQELAKLSNQMTENAIARNDAATKVAITAAQNAGQTQARFAQEMGNISQVMQNWEKINLAKGEQKARQQEALKQQLRELAKQQAAEAAAKKEEHHKQQEAQAFIAVRDVMSTMQQDAYSQNPLYVRNKMLEAIYKYDVRPDKVPELLGPAYTMLHGIDKEQFTKRQDYADKVQTQILSGQKMVLANVISGALARLKNDTSGDVQPLLDEIEGHVNGFIQQYPNMGVLDAITLQNFALEEAGKSMTLSADNREKIRAQLNNNAAFVNELGPLVEQLNGGEIGIERYKFMLEDLATKYNIPIQRAIDLGDPTAARKFMVDQLDLQNKLVELQNQGVAADLPQSNLSDMQVGTLTWYLYKHPDQYNAIKNGNSPFKKDPSFLRAEGVLDAYGKYQTKRQQAEQEYRRLEQQQRAFGEDTLASAKGSQAGGDFKSQIEQKIQVYFPGMDTSRLTEDAYKTWEEFRRQGNALFDQQKAAILNSYADDYSTMQQYGLHEGEKSIQFTQGKYDAVRQQINQLHQSVQPQQIQKGTSPNFNAGRPAQSSTQFARAEWKGTPIILPFRAGTQATIGDGYGGAGSPAHGRDRPHAGLDIAVAEGTPITSTGTGVVVHVSKDPAGYGNFLDVKFDDGSIQRFGHLQGSYVVAGQRVQLGQVLGKAGSTGRSNGPHLHWEFRRKSEGGYENSTDPVFESNKLLATIGTIRPRDDNLGWQSPYNPYGGTSPKSLSALIPKNALPLWGGYYILDNKVQSVQDPGVNLDVSTYNRRNPVKGTYVSRDKTGWRADRDNNPANNYHYAALARDEQFRKSVHQVASNLNIPAYWLADIMAFETGGTFDPSKDNGVGYTGLIQFGDASARDLGTTRAELAKMSRAQQMQYVERYFKKQMKAAGLASIDNVETALALVWGGPGLARTFAKNPERARNSSDRWTSFKGYLDELGRHAGRRYNHIYNERRSNVAQVMHTSYVDGCPMCNQMIQSNSQIVPHEGQ